MLRCKPPILHPVTKMVTVARQIQGGDIKGTAMVECEKEGVQADTSAAECMGCYPCYVLGMTGYRDRQDEAVEGEFVDTGNSV